MTWQDQIRYYGQRHNLLEGDVEFMLGLFERAIAEERKRCADIAWKMQMETFGGGTAIGNMISDPDYKVVR